MANDEDRQHRRHGESMTVFHSEGRKTGKKIACSTLIAKYLAQVNMNHASKKFKYITTRRFKDRL